MRDDAATPGPVGRNGDERAWLESLRAERDWREQLYRGDETPFSPEALAGFRGLRWFPPERSLRLSDVVLSRHASPTRASLSVTGEERVDFLEVGSVEFGLDDRTLSLRVFEPAPGEVEETYLFIPFRDATSGHETYGGGRYLDLEPRGDDTYELDFNRAYHPYCVHDEKWSCTIPPPENRLNVRITAGERL